MSSTYKPTPKADILKVFPEIPGAIIGGPMLKQIMHILRHLIDCAQSHEVEHNNGLSLLHIVIPAALYAFSVTDSANQQYPTRAVDPGNITTHNTVENIMIWSNKKNLSENMEK